MVSKMLIAVLQHIICLTLRMLRGNPMRLFATRKAGVITATATAAFVALVAASASAATMVANTITIGFGPSFPDPTTWALMLLSFGLIGVGVRSRKRSVVLS